MARLAFLLRRPCRRPELPAASSRRGERGATLTEYGLIVALVVVAAMGGIMQLQDESGSYLVETGSDVGQPRELAADMSPDLPEEPNWLPQPPAPTTTTTTAPSTTTTAAATTSTTAATTSTTAATTSTTAATTTSTTAATTSTTAGSYPVGAVIYDGPMHSKRKTDQCFVVVNPGVVNSDTNRVDCTGGNNQTIQAVGSATEVAIRWKTVSAGHCLTASGATSVMKVCAADDNQLFTVTVDGNGWIRFQSKANSGKCLAEYYTGFEIEDCSNTSDRQKFKF